MQIIFGWTQEETDIKCVEVLKYNMKNMILMPHPDREWFVSFTLHNIIHDRNDKIGAFEVINHRK